MIVIHGLRADIFCSQISDDNRYTVISEDALENPPFMIDAIADIRLEILNHPSRACSDYFVDMLLAMEGYFINVDGSEYIFTDALAEERRDFWRHTIQTPEPRTKALQLREESRDFIRELLSIYKARYPAKAALWGVRPANDL